MQSPCHKLFHKLVPLIQIISVKKIKIIRKFHRKPHIWRVFFHTWCVISHIEYQYYPSLAKEAAVLGSRPTAKIFLKAIFPQSYRGMEDLSCRDIVPRYGASPNGDKLFARKKRTGQ